MNPLESQLLRTVCQELSDTKAVFVSGKLQETLDAQLAKMDEFYKLNIHTGWGNSRYAIQYFRRLNKTIPEIIKLSQKGDPQAISRAIVLYRHMKITSSVRRAFYDAYNLLVPSEFINEQIAIARLNAIVSKVGNPVAHIVGRSDLEGVQLQRQLIDVLSGEIELEEFRSELVINNPGNCFDALQMSFAHTYRLQNCSIDKRWSTRWSAFFVQIVLSIILEHDGLGSQIGEIRFDLLSKMERTPFHRENEISQYNSIQERLDLTGKTVAWLAGRMIENVETVTDWCENRTQPSIEVLFKIAKILFATPGDLLVDPYKRKLL